MRLFQTVPAVAAALLVGSLVAPGAGAYPGGTPGFVTDAAPYCSSCHSSVTEEALAGAPGGRAQKELAQNKHLALIEAGEGGYESLTAEQRAELTLHVRALEEASTVTLTAPPRVAPGEEFNVTVDLTGGAGPVIGVGLVDVPHRWLARPATAVGWDVVAPPTIIGQDFKEQTEWLEGRPAELGRNLTYVNVKGVSSDASKQEWGRAQVVWKLRAPPETGTYPLGAAYWFGTEKASPLGTVEDPIRGKVLRGGFTGSSGRVMFSTIQRVQVVVQ